MTTQAKFILRKGTAAAWASANPILAAGEPAYVTDTKIFKVGDGVTAFSGLASYADAAGLAALVSEAETAVTEAEAARDDVEATLADLQFTNVRPEDGIINGAFTVWQRALSGSSSGYVAADRWRNTFLGGTVMQARQDVALGDTFGRNNPVFCLRQTVSGQTLAGHYAATQQRIEGVRSYAGQTITVLGWARRTAGSGKIVVETSQSFGTGGSPSAITTQAPVDVTLSGAWQPFAATFVVPGVAGKTLGSNGDDSFEVNFWASAGADYNARTGSLGLQAITVDLWGVHIRIGTFVAADAAEYLALPVTETLRQCRRYYEKGLTFIQSPAAGAAGASMQFKDTKRIVPTIGFSISSAVTWANTTPQGVNTEVIGFNGIADTAGGFAFINWTADAEL